MPRDFHPHDIRLMLSFLHATTGAGETRMDLEAERATDGAPLFRVSLTADQFARLMSSREVVVQSWTQPGQAFCPNPADHEPPCDETEHDRRGDCHGKVREYVAFVNDVLGRKKGEPVHLCATHAQLRGPQIIRRVHTSAVLP